MAINQRFNSSPGSAPVVYLEQPTEPGEPRLFWAAGASPPAWTTPGVLSPAYQIPTPEDALIPGQFLLQIPTAVTVLWPNKVYLATVLDPNSATKNDILVQFSINLVAGDDGGNGISGIPIAIPNGQYAAVGSFVGNIVFPPVPSPVNP